MITRELIQSISNFNSELFPVLSFYLDVDVPQQNTGAYKIAAKGLSKSVREWVKANSPGLAREQIQSVNKDVEKYLARIAELSIPTGASSYVVFTCTGEGFWRELFLPRSFQNTVKIGVDPFVRRKLEG